MSKTVLKKKVSVKSKRLGFKITRIAKEPESRKRAMHVVQAEVDKELFNAAKAKLDERGVHIREIVAWAFQSFLLTYDRKEAVRLGVSD